MNHKRMSNGPPDYTIIMNAACELDRLRTEIDNLKAQISMDCPTCHEPIYNVRGAIADMDGLRRENFKLREALEQYRGVELPYKGDVAGKVLGEAK